jgi:hypothetical protein
LLKVKHEQLLMDTQQELKGKNVEIEVLKEMVKGV